MKRLLPILVIGILILGGFGASALSISKIKEKSTLLFDDVLDQSQTVMTENTAIPVGNIPIPDNPIYVQVAQSFIPTKEILTRLELFIGKNSTAIYPLSVSIREELTEDDLTVIDIDPSLVPTEDYDWVEIDFDDITVLPGSTYYIVALTENVTDNYYAWGANNDSESYPYGCTWYSLNEGANWTNESASSSYPSTNDAFSNQGAQPIFEGDLTWDMCFKTYGQDNSAPETPVITGETNGKTGRTYTYCIETAVDPDGDEIYVYWDWGDGTNSGWLGPYASGEQICTDHSWSEDGTYTVKAKLRDEYGAESDWGTLSVTMPVNQQISNSHSVFTQILQQILGQIIMSRMGINTQ